MIYTWRHEHQWFPTSERRHGSPVSECATCGDRAYDVTTDPVNGGQK